VGLQSLRIPEAALAQHIAVLGKTRSGKSSVMRGLVEGILDREQPVCIVDPKGDWWGIKLARRQARRLPGRDLRRRARGRADQRARRRARRRALRDRQPAVPDRPGRLDGRRAHALLHRLRLDALQAHEGHALARDRRDPQLRPEGQGLDPDAGKALHWTNRLASEGLGKGLPMLFASQRPQKVHNDTLTSAETLIAMRVLHPSDRGAVSDWIKGCGDLELGAKVLNSLAQMDRGEGWVWSPEIGLGPERVKFPMFKTYDSFRPQTAEDAKPR
jgi:DNA helicase HerA-like ATPase